MQTKSEILAKIEELKAIADKLPDEPQGLWKPKDKERYFLIDNDGNIYRDVWLDVSIDNYRYAIGNCFKTREEAQAKLEDMQVHQQLKEIAHELNNGEKIDWKNGGKSKYYLFFDFNDDKLTLDWRKGYKHANTIYCLSEEFKNVAIERIGKEKLERYLKWGF